MCLLCISNYVQVTKRDDLLPSKKAKDKKKIIHRPVCSVWTEAKRKVPSQCTVPSETKSEKNNWVFSDEKF